MEKVLARVSSLIDSHRADEAIAEARVWIDGGGAPSDELYYLMGNAWRKKGDWQKAIDSWLEAVSINPESPAREAIEFADEILSFYNKDMYNQ